MILSDCINRQVFHKRCLHREIEICLYCSGGGLNAQTIVKNCLYRNMVLRLPAQADSNFKSEHFLQFRGAQEAYWRKNYFTGILLFNCRHRQILSSNENIFSLHCTIQGLIRQIKGETACTEILGSNILHRQILISYWNIFSSYCCVEGLKRQMGGKTAST